MTAFVVVYRPRSIGGRAASPRSDSAFRRSSTGHVAANRTGVGFPVDQRALPRQEIRATRPRRGRSRLPRHEAPVWREFREPLAAHGGAARPSPVRADGAGLARGDVGQRLPSARLAVPGLPRDGALFRELREPPVVTGEMMEEAFGRIPGLLTPPAYPEARVRRLLELAGVAIAA